MFPFQIIITASEIDAVAVHESTGLPAMCLSPRLAQSPLDYLSKSKKLVLWLDGKSRSKLDRILDLESIDVRLVRRVAATLPFLSAISHT